MEESGLIKIGENTKVSLHFSLSLNDGSVVDYVEDKSKSLYKSFIKFSFY